MNIAIRVDASSQIGTGHFMRTLTLAKELSKRGAKVRFVSRHLPEYLQDMLSEKVYEFRILDRPINETMQDELAHSKWLGTTQHEDAQDTTQALSDRIWDWLVIDNYALDARWESVLRKSAKRLLVIDDLADRMHDCDILLDQNYYADKETRYTGKVPVTCQLLLGPHYALLREEFSQWRQQVKPRTGSVKRILVFFGGVDADNFTGLTIDALARLGISGLHIDVVIGAQHPYREKIESACIEYMFSCYVQTDRMAELMATADLAIGAGGSATWERCCLGLPSLVVSLADNQTDIVKGLDLLGAGQYIESQVFANSSVLLHYILGLIENRKFLKSLSEQAFATNIGDGVNRVCQALSL